MSINYVDQSQRANHYTTPQYSNVNRVLEVLYCTALLPSVWCCLFLRPMWLEDYDFHGCVGDVLAYSALCSAPSNCVWHCSQVIWLACRYTETSNGNYASGHTYQHTGRRQWGFYSSKTGGAVLQSSCGLLGCPSLLDTPFSHQFMKLSNVYENFVTYHQFECNKTSDSQSFDRQSEVHECYS